MPEYVMPLSFEKPPLSANQTMHWGKRAKIVKKLRHEAFIRAKSMRLPKTQFATITLHYQPSVRRNRDAHNLYPTVKALVDGIVDAGVVPDDNTDHVSAPEPVIHPPTTSAPGRCWLVIRT